MTGKSTYLDKDIKKLREQLQEHGRYQNSEGIHTIYKHEMASHDSIASVLQANETWQIQIEVADIPEPATWVGLLHTLDLRMILGQQLTLKVSLEVLLDPCLLLRLGMDRDTLIHLPFQCNLRRCATALFRNLLHHGVLQQWPGTARARGADIVQWVGIAKRRVSSDHQVLRLVVISECLVLKVWMSFVLMDFGLDRRRSIEVVDLGDIEVGDADVASIFPRPFASKSLHLFPGGNNVVFRCPGYIANRKMHQC